MKYGGKLDFTYGMLPVLEPAFDNALKWENPEIQNGQRTIPSGPIKWEKSSDGELSAIAVGCENGVPRNKVVARFPPSSPKIEQKTLRVAPPSLFRTTTGVSTHPVISDDADLYNDENPPLDDDESTDMQSGISSPHNSGYTVVDSSNRTIGSAPLAVPVMSASSSSLAPANASVISATSATSGTSSTVATPPVGVSSSSTAPSMTASYASSDLSASSNSTILTQASKDQGTRSEIIDDSSSVTSKSKSKMGGSVYRAALNKATKAMESVGLVSDRKSSPTPSDSTTASVSSPPMSPPMSPPPHSQTNSTMTGSNASIASSERTAASINTEVRAGAGVGAGSIEKSDIEEALRNKYASGKH